MPFSASSAPDSSSSGRRSAKMRPSLTSTMRSTLRQSISSRRCSMMRTVVSVFCWIESISSMACLPVAGSRFASGSSKSRIFTSSTMTPTTDALLLAPESSCGRNPGGSRCPPARRRGGSSRAFRPAGCSCFPAQRRYPPHRQADELAVRILQHGADDPPAQKYCCGARPHRLQSACPCTLTGVGEGFRPLMQAASVDLPLPDGPAIRTRSPGRYPG